MGSHIFPALDTANNFSGTDNFKVQNGICYASQYSGADLGIQINAAIADCQARFGTGIICVDSPGGTISTSPNLPIGFAIVFLPNIFTLATTWAIKHRGTVYNFNGAQFQYNQDAGNPAFIVGKNMSGTVNTNGTAVTWVSGNTFSDFDTGDQIFINGGTANIASVNSATSLTLTATAGVQSGVAYAGYLNTQTALGTFMNSVAIRDLTINYTGAGTQVNTGIRYESISDVLTENLYIGNFATGNGLVAQGMLECQFNNLKLNNCKNALLLDQRNAGGLTVSSNSNLFYSPQIIGSPVGGNPLAIQNGSFGNMFQGGDFEGNLATVFCVIQSGATGNIFIGCDHEKNGDGTVSAADYNVLASGNIFIGNRFTSAVANRPASGIVASTGATRTMLLGNTWQSGTFYTTAWNFINGATGPIINNDPASFAVGNPATGIEDSSGNYVVNGFNWAGAGWGGSAFHTALPNGTLVFPNATNIYWASAANNALVPFANLNASNAYVIDPNNQGLIVAGKTLTTSAPPSQTIGTGNVTTAGTAVGAGTAQAQTNITVSGALTTDTVIANIGATLPATWQTGIQVVAHVTASNTVTVYLINPTAGSITPAATQVNVRVVR